MTDLSHAGRRPPVAGGRARASAQLGTTLRSVLINPQAGFRGALATAGLRSVEGVRPAEGVTPFVLAALGGGSLMLLWLKIAGLVGFRDAPRTEFRWAYVVTALVAGGILGLASQLLWGSLGPRVARALQSDVTGRDLRLVWGASAFPQVVPLLLIPLDIVVVGTDVFTSERLTDSVETVWGALSIAIAVSVAAWSVYIFVRGVQVATRLTGWRIVPPLVVAVLLPALLFGVPIVAPKIFG